MQANQQATQQANQQANQMRNPLHAPIQLQINQVTDVVHDLTASNIADSYLHSLESKTINKVRRRVKRYSNTSPQILTLDVNRIASEIISNAVVTNQLATNDGLPLESYVTAEVDNIANVVVDVLIDTVKHITSEIKQGQKRKISSVIDAIAFEVEKEAKINYNNMCIHCGKHTQGVDSNTCASCYFSNTSLNSGGVSTNQPDIKIPSIDEPPANFLPYTRPSLQSLKKIEESICNLTNGFADVLKNIRDIQSFVRYQLNTDRIRNAT